MVTQDSFQTLGWLVLMQKIIIPCYILNIQYIRKLASYLLNTVQDGDKIVIISNNEKFLLIHNKLQKLTRCYILENIIGSDC